MSSGTKCADLGPLIPLCAADGTDWLEGGQEKNHPKTPPPASRGSGVLGAGQPLRGELVGKRTKEREPDILGHRNRGRKRGKALFRTGELRGGLR